LATSLERLNTDPDAFFEYATESMGRYVGLEH